MIIEIPKIQDYESITKLAQQVHNLHVKWRPDIFVNTDNILSIEELHEMITNNEIFVARIDNIVVGYVICKICEKDSRGLRYRKQLNIEVICVDSENRGNGIGTKLLEYMKEYAKKNECTDMYLTVNEENENAIHLYESFGMRVKNIAYSLKIE